MIATRTVLRVRGLRKVFGDTVALRAADLEVRAGEIHALLGENGAGKSTLIKILAGVYPPDGGTIELGEEEWPHGTRPKGGAGVAFIHQDPVVFPDLSVAENMPRSRPIRSGGA